MLYQLINVVLVCVYIQCVCIYSAPKLHAGFSSDLNTCSCPEYCFKERNRWNCVFCLKAFLESVTKGTKI